ncbi:CDP-diacylglycerol--serine O-phosphatidyltransferase [Rhodospirillaceae bacterium SYSU D60014]|uniref:CDP-diacylglycerol--serine O-phosphatidyltransferase n=1 Tax=Virgifigura deserti TaxID=2268457 RepID=UPI000E67046C
MRRRPGPRLRDQSINRLIPNILTVSALCAGLTSIRFALQDRWELAVLAIVIAGILDGLDGRIARLLDGASKFGAELDSLSDFISFGVAPALVLYYWTMYAAGGLGWAISLLFAVCCALRLARFNTKLDNADLPAWTSRFFTGVPAPAGAGLSLLPLLATFQFGSGFFDLPIVAGAVMLGVALLMVSRVPTFSFKRVKVPQHYVVPTLIGVGVFAAFLVSMPWVTLMTAGVVYVASIPLSYIAYRQLERRRRPEDFAEVEEPTDTPLL